MFTRTSRYHDIEIATFTAPDGRQIRHVGRRFIPRTTAAAVLAEHPVVAGDRLDNITARYLGDPEQYWRLCDANAAERPTDLTARAGRVLIVTMPLPR